MVFLDGKATDKLAVGGVVKNVVVEGKRQMRC